MAWSLIEGNPSVGVIEGCHCIVLIENYDEMVLITSYSLQHKCLNVSPKFLDLVTFCY